MRRLSLSTKLFAAGLPLILAVGGLLALTVRSDLNEIDRAESGVELGGVWEPLIAALTAVEAEAATLAPVSEDAPASTADPAARRATDQAINDVRLSIENLGAFEAASAHVTEGRSALSAARRNVDMAEIAPSMVSDIDPIDAYGIASRELVAIGQLLPSEAGDEELGRQLLALVKLAESKLHANDVIVGTLAWPNEAVDKTPLAQASDSFASMVTTLGEFEAIAPDEWSTAFRQSGFNTQLGAFNTSLTNVTRAADAGRVETFDTAAFSEFVAQIVEFESSISESIVETSNAQADSTRTATMRRIGIILAILLVATAIAWLITRSVTRRVKAVANSANRVASEQLPALVEALRDPRGKAVLPDIEPVDARGGDDLAELATAFNSMQETLIDVAHEQVEVLRRGVSDIFITMARRNRSLIDRQLSMLDEFEAGVDDHEVLSNYYQLDHLATRMRRNSESLLVLANAEPKRRRVKATEIDDVVRASIGEVEDYRRVEIQQLESLQVRGAVVADISHLLAELLDNATSFSPPGSSVRVGGRRADHSYMLRIVDDGVGIGPERLGELNELLREPPIVGLSVESTLGISVVSLLANKHGIDVTLSAGSPGLTVDVILPSSLFGPMDAPAEQPTLPPALGEPAAEQLVAWDGETAPGAAPDSLIAGAVVAGSVVAGSVVADSTVAADDVAAEPTVPVLPTVPTHEQPGDRPEDPAATAPAAPAADWTAMSLDMSEFETAALSEEPPAIEPTPVEAAIEAAPADEPTSEPMPEPIIASVPADLPPPAPARPEFDVPVAPPISANGLTHRPVTPDTARPAPTLKPIDDTPLLPTRTQRGTGPDGPDRLADPAGTTVGDTPVATSEPGALQAALAAYDAGRAAVNAPAVESLPTRDRTTEPLHTFDEQQPVTQSRVDPSALRDRLRAFQTEFTSASSEPTAGHDIYADHHADHNNDRNDDRDSGGDPR